MACGRLPEAVSIAVRRFQHCFCAFQRCYVAEKSPKLPEAAPWLANGLLVVCLWWLGATRN
eukprot:1688864-Alexandrium_andersonii.AAC.1